MKDKKQEIKKGSKVIIEIEKTIFPHTGISYLDNKEIRVKNVLPGQKVKVLLKKKKKDYYEGRLLEIIEKSTLENYTPECDHYENCGGCSRQTIAYDNQLELKYNQVKKL
ncbi:MAG: TRAM domain-containing protein, partial [bacterium]